MFNQLLFLQMSLIISVYDRPQDETTGTFPQAVFGNESPRLSVNQAEPVALSVANAFYIVYLRF